MRSPSLYPDEEKWFHFFSFSGVRISYTRGDYISFCCSFLQENLLLLKVSFLLNTLKKGKLQRGQTLELTEGEGMHYLLLSTCKRRDIYHAHIERGRNASSFVDVDTFMAKYYAPFALLHSSSKTLVYCSEKSDESSPKSFFLLPIPSALYTLILSAWF